jgi:hypothetical protein
MCYARIPAMGGGALAFACCLMAVAVPTAAADWAASMFETTSHDFGPVARGAKAEYEFVLTNRFKTNVHIASAVSSCGCTTPTVVKEWLKPYEQGAILAHLNSGAYLGRRHATVTVTIDQPNFATVQLDVAAVVHEDVMIEPGSVDLGNVEAGTAAEGKAIIYRANRPDWQVWQANSADPHVSPKIVELARQNGQVWYELRVHLDDKATPGPLQAPIALTTNDPSAPQIPILIEGRVLPKVAVSPTSLFLGVLQPGEKATRQLVVWSKKPFRISQILGDPNCFQVGANDRDEAKPVHRIPLTFIAGQETGKIVRTIRIKTDVQDALVEASTYAVVESQGQ